MPESEAYQKGREMRRRLLGDAYASRTSGTTYADPIMKKFMDVATETVFGSLWTRPGLDLKTRTLITLVSDAATGREPELAIHLRMALRQAVFRFSPWLTPCSSTGMPIVAMNRCGAAQRGSMK